uniref:SET domain-containing protein n=1 Tax=Rhizochromulina marina TaxID=1034831 RepID=A0A7S2SI05_9STRA
MPQEYLQESSLQERMDSLHRWIDVAISRQPPALQVPRVFEVRLKEGSLRSGLFARAPVKRGDIYTSVPWECVMTAEKALHSPYLGPVFRQIEQRFGKRDDATILALYLISERARGRESPWWPYIQTLPSDEEFQHLPFYWSDADLEELRGSLFYLDVLDQRKRVAEGWHRLYSRILAFRRYTFNPWIFTAAAFRWAYHVWQTRCIFVHPKPPRRTSQALRDPDETHLNAPFEESSTFFKAYHDQLSLRGSVWAFVPFVDFTNCRFMDSQRMSRTEYDSQLQAVTMAAPEDIGQDEEIYENYGWSNHSYLLSHGFMLDDHPEDSLHLPPLFMPIYDEQRCFLLNSILHHKLGHAIPSTYPISLSRSIQPEMLAVVYVVEEEEEEIQRIMRNLVDQVDDGTSTRREVAQRLLLQLPPAALGLVFASLVRYTKGTLLCWERGSLERDAAILEDPTVNLRPHQRLAIEFRLSQRRLASDLVQFYDELEAMSREKARAQETEVDKREPGGKEKSPMPEAKPSDSKRQDLNGGASSLDEQRLEEYAVTPESRDGQEQGHAAGSQVVAATMPQAQEQGGKAKAGPVPEAGMEITTTDGAMAMAVPGSWLRDSVGSSFEYPSPGKEEAGQERDEDEQEDQEGHLGLYGGASSPSSSSL